MLKKTKLGEADLIVTLLAEDGQQLRVVAKGARKPRSSFASRLELYSVVDVLCAKGRSLDIAKEARLVESNERLRRDLEHAAAAAPMAELLDRVTQAGLENPRLFALTQAAFAHLCACSVGQAPALTAAHLLKTLAFCGFRPCLHVCVHCGGPVLFPSDPSVSPTVWFSPAEGGVLCPACRSSADAVPVSGDVIAWTGFFLGSTFEEVKESGADPSAAFAVLGVCRQWVREHVGAHLKSLDFLFANGLYR